MSNSIMKAMPKANVFQIHFLSVGGLAYYKDYHMLKMGCVPLHIIDGYVLRRHMDTLVSWPTKIISLVRDPVARMVSDIFENARWLYPHVLDKRTDRIVPDLVVRDIEAWLENFDEKSDYVSSWFDKEFRAAIGIDVYAYPFGKESGNVVLKRGYLDILIIQMEKLGKTSNQTIGEFLGLEGPLELVIRNTSEGKKDAAEYSDVLRFINIKRDLLERVYSTKYAQHFYDDDDKMRFIARWSRPRG